MFALFVTREVGCLEVSKAELFFASFPSRILILIAHLQNQCFYGGHLKAKNTVKWSCTQSILSSSLFLLKSCCCCFGLISRWESAKKILSHLFLFFRFKKIQNVFFMIYPTYIQNVRFNLVLCQGYIILIMVIADPHHKLLNILYHPC